MLYRASLASTFARGVGDATVAMSLVDQTLFPIA